MPDVKGKMGKITKAVGDKTKGAVKGLGNGNVREGIKKMYSVMRDLESRSKRMA